MIDPGAPPPHDDQANSTQGSPSAPRLRPTTILNALFVALAATALIVIALRSEPSPGIEVERRHPAGNLDTVVVQVRGAVGVPGIYTMAPGDRVDDAIRRAGGPLIDADLSALNLALRVRDEDVVHVAVRGEGTVRLVDLNDASQSDLERLPGIGPVRATAIIAARPFATVEELIERGIVPAAVCEQLRLLVTTDTRR
ncbi:MAG: ComEA family DNA-binding protein [Chloroflexi bacterium]|nr:ComEA family DNA-binding protein [Chloroflexota bacterium]